MSENFLRVLRERDEAKDLAEHIRAHFDAAGEKLIAIRKVIES